MKTWETSNIDCKNARRVGTVGRKNGSRRQLVHAMEGADRLAAVCGAGDVGDWKTVKEATDATLITCPKCLRIAARTKFIEETRNASRTERELFAMSAILEGACMDRLAQMYDFDDFEGVPRQALELAINDESGAPADDALYCALAVEFIDHAISEFLPGAQTR